MKIVKLFSRFYTLPCYIALVAFFLFASFNPEGAWSVKVLKVDWRTMAPRPVKSLAVIKIPLRSEPNLANMGYFCIQQNIKYRSNELLAARTIINGVYKFLELGTLVVLSLTVLDAIGNMFYLFFARLKKTSIEEVLFMVGFLIITALTFIGPVPNPGVGVCLAGNYAYAEVEAELINISVKDMHYLLLGLMLVIIGGMLIVVRYIHYRD